MSTDLTRMPNTGLSWLERNLEAKVNALRSASSAIAVALLQEYRARLDAVRAEIERRARV